MVQVSLTYVTEVINTGIQNDLNVGVSLLDPDTGQELVMLPWWVIWDVPTGQGYNVTISGISGDIPAMTYLAKCRAWTDHTPGTKVGDLDSIGVLYQAGTGSLHPPILDEATQTLVIPEVPGEIAAKINVFTITV